MEKNRYYDPFAALNRTKKEVYEKKLFTETVAVGTCSITRKDNNEKITINVSPFVIGTKPDSCNYVVTDNKYVGRNHARIMVQDGKYFFVDNNSTNKSYVNGTQAPPQTSIQLKNGDEIKLANLSFTFIVG